MSGFVQLLEAERHRDNEVGRQEERASALLSALYESSSSIGNLWTWFPETIQTQVQRAENQPLIRDTLFRVFFAWISKEGTTSIESMKLYFTNIKLVLVRGCTDIWSAIRKRCSQALSRLQGLLSIEQFEDLCHTFVDIFHSHHKI